MESLDLTYKLFDLKIKVEHLTKSTLCFKYFRNIVIVMTKGKNKKIKISKIDLFLLPPLPSQDGRGLQPPPPPKFSRQRLLTFFFIDTWVSGQRVGKLTEWQSQRKGINGTRENPKGGWGWGCNNPPPS